MAISMRLTEATDGRSIDRRRAVSERLFDTSESIFYVRDSTRRCYEDEIDLRWAALEKLPTYDRLKVAFVPRENSGSAHVFHEQVDIRNIDPAVRQELLDRLVHIVGDDNESFVQKLRDRIDRVGIKLPETEVRYEHLSVNTEVYQEGRALRTLANFTLNIIENILSSLKILKSKKKPLAILKDVRGIVRPGRLTLLLGPPSAGKTTLLLALSGKLENHLKVSGSVTYNGHTMREFVPQRTSAYISQHDLHDGNMTVKETLDFSARCQGVEHRIDMLTELARREKESSIKPDPDIDFFMKAAGMQGQKSTIVSDYIVKVFEMLLGMEVCADTMVGDNMRRGISGGQKKRLTTGEMMVGPSKAFFMDEISTGLDSSTTYQIVQCLKHIIHVSQSTMVISLLQPAPETFNLFDDVILICEGQIVCQGPRVSIMDFFDMMGFKCPERKGVADFLQEVISSKDQQQYWYDKNKPYHFIPVEEFSNAFRSFHVGKDLHDALLVPYDKSNCHPAALVKKKYGISKIELLKACFDREILMMKRNSFIFIFRSVQVSLIVLITITVFLRTKMDPSSVLGGKKYMALLFFCLVNMIFNGAAESQMTMIRLPVFYKQRDAMFYPPWAYALPQILLGIPVSLLEASIWVLLTYYAVGLAPNPQRFFRQWLLLFNLHQMSVSMFRGVTAVGRDRIVTNTFGAFALLIVFVLGGYIISRDDIHPWWLWGYWSSPLMYAQNAIAVNEFLATRWNMRGVILLKLRGWFTDDSWFWIGNGAVLAYSFLFNILYIIALSYLNPLSNTRASISKANDTSSDNFSTKGRTDIEVQDSGQNHENRKKGMVLPFKPLSMAFDNVNYFVNMPAEVRQQGEVRDRLQLLHGVSGTFRPGILTCLMGVSGAGKTTLMDVLAGRKTGGYIEGSITISGHPKRQETFARISGYCEQNDIHSPNLTVYESLVYSAWLRLPADIDDDTREMFVREVMDLVELDTLKDALVGVPGVTGLSTEQRKRLTIAVELVANPSIIFMDEPTSGLDARAAAIIMRTVRNTVDTGRTVVCTIHQPSIDIFESFDELLLMKRGGQVIYSGPLGTHSQELINYFEAVDGVPKITPGYNPATWMLEASSVASEDHLGIDFAEIYLNSCKYQRNKEVISELQKPIPGSEDIHFKTRFSQSLWVQLKACLWKQHWSYWRNPQYNVVRFFYTFICSLLIGSIFWKRGKNIAKEQDFLNAMGSMYASVVFLGISSGVSIQPVVDIERTVFYRERAAGVYSALPYALAQVLIEVPYTFFQTILYGLIVYAAIDYEWTVAKFLLFFMFMFITFLTYTYFGMMTLALCPNAPIAMVVSTALYRMWMLFCGFLIPRTSIPIWWRWYYWCCPVSWTLYGLVASQFGDKTTSMLTYEQDQVPIKDYLRTQFDYHHDMLPVVAGAAIAFPVLFALIFACSIRVLNFQNR